MTEPSRIVPPTLHLPVRTQVRSAVERAWTRAMEAGSLPALAADVARPAVEVERPADPSHGDFATNLAMRLARPYRMAPLAIAGGPGRAARARVRRRSGVDPGGDGRRGAARVPQHAPGRSSARVDRRGDPCRARRLGTRRAPRPALGQRRVRVGQSDRSTAYRQRPRRIRRRPALPGPGGRRPAGDARVLLQRFGWTDPEPGCVRGGAPARRSGAGRRLQGRLRRRPGRRAAGRGLGTSHLARCRHGRDRRPLGGRSGPGGDRAKPGRPRRPVRRLDQRGATARRRVGRPGGAAAPRPRPRLRAGRRHLVPLDRFR